MRLTDFWQRMDAVFGAGYAPSIATDQVLTTLGGKTVREAMDSGVDTVVIWRAVCAAYPDRVPAALR